MKIKYWIMTFALIFISSNFVYASSCMRDIDQMSDQIARYGSITSVDSYKFTKISFAYEQENTCSAQAYDSMYPEKFTYVCSVRWVKGNWGNTLACQ